MMNDKTVLITGGTGSFGRKLVDSVLARYEVRIPRHLALDIDTPEDWELAERIFEVL